MPELPGPGVLIAGDAESDFDLARLLDGLGVVRTTRGIPAAVTALRTGEFGVVVADLTSVDDALSIVRAAARCRPPAPVICLFPADLDAPSERLAVLEQATFWHGQHPLPRGFLRGLVTAAGDVNRVERTRRPARPVQADWSAAERELTASLVRLLEEIGGRAPDRIARDTVLRCVEAAAEIARTENDGPGLLLAIARALREPGQANQAQEAAA